MSVAAACGDERRAERLHAPARDRQPGRGAVAAVAQQVGARRLQPAEQVERRDRAARAGALLAVERDQHGRAMVALGDPRGDDADHARMPAVGGEHVGGGSAPPAPRASATCASASNRIRVSTSRRSALTASSSAATARARCDVGGQQQLQPRVGAVQPPGGVDPRREPEADRAGVDAARVHARDLHQRLQPGLARRGERAQALAHERAGSRRRAARSRRPSRARRGPGRRRRAAGSMPGGLQQRPREHVRDARRAQLRARVAADAPGARSARPAAGRRRAARGGR